MAGANPPADASIVSYLAAEWNPLEQNFFGNMSQKKFAKKLDPGIDMCLAPGQEGGGNETHSHLARPRTPARTTWDFLNLRKITLDFDAPFEYNYLKLRKV